jgi:hypothetical protein
MEAQIPFQLILNMNVDQSEAICSHTIISGTWGWFPCVADRSQMMGGMRNWKHYLSYSQSQAPFGLIIFMSSYILLLFKRVGISSKSIHRKQSHGKIWGIVKTILVHEQTLGCLTLDKSLFGKWGQLSCFLLFPMVVRKNKIKLFYCCRSLNFW